MAKTPTHVAVAVITREGGDVLIARRPDHLHQGGKWEFPGGKVESGEPVLEALQREMTEELGVTARRFLPLIRIHYAYTDKDVLLDVWQVADLVGEPNGREGQPIAWVSPELLSEYSFPEANLPIITAVCLPRVLLVTGEPEQDRSQFLRQLEAALRGGIRLVQLRAKTLDPAQFFELARRATELCHRYRAKILVNADPDVAVKVNADGVHLSSLRLNQLSARPLPRGKLVSASVHSERELLKAQSVGVDFAIAAPVNPTKTHPCAQSLGWDEFQRLAELASVPLFALGGMRAEQLVEACQKGGQGIAVLGAIWSAVDGANAAMSIIAAQDRAWVAV